MTSLGTWLRRERSLWIAGLILVAATLVPGAALVPVDLEAGLGAAAYCAYLLLLLRYVRGSSASLDPGSPRTGRGIGPWGYVWRSYLVLMVTIVPLVVVAAAGSSPGGGRRLARYLPWLDLLVLPPVVTWLMFGRDRWAALTRLFKNREGSAGT